MAWYPRAIRLELQPESDQQAAIVPTQFIMHSIAAPWDEKRIYEYWRDSTNLESHFGLDFDGSLGQFIGTQTKADANYSANRRPDGTGAVSIETASNLKHTDAWTQAQIEVLIALGVWLHRTHDIPLRVCRSASDPGFGYHRLFAAWSVGGTDCPGDARVRQFHDVVFPGIVRAAQGQPPIPAPRPEPPAPTPVPPVEDEMPYTERELNPGFAPVRTMAIPPSVPAGKRMFLNVGADGNVVGDAFAFVSGEGWRELGDFVLSNNDDLAFFELPAGTRKVVLYRREAQGIEPDAPAAFNIEVV